MGKFIDFDKYMAERGQELKTVRIFGRDCDVPQEVPFDYMMTMLKLSAEEQGMTASANIRLLQQMFKQDDYEFITTHPSFKLSDVHALVRKIWLESDDDEADEPDEITEDNLAIEKSGANRRKKA